ncbi:NitT/TauT family transport system ATP-binding protein [Rhizobium petrolearium]|uniref:ABC transporter ATP-binding protein n=1 Tax=Neorhizobium petrolearium TaxID=515361 RepID=UPI001AE52959|nr:ABC transporter ATP-binding protein [Neorhizobium petrolearium]MBP1848139.1 NitT/TauT family transport system ATP-binding protein [Neorhizobium petrolearium]
MMKELRLESVQIAYGAKTVLEKIDLTVQGGEIICLIGASGCGKSTLLNAVAGLVPIRSGSIVLNDSPVVGPAADRVMVFQDDAVFPWMKVRDNIEFGLKVKRIPPAERQRIVEEKLAAVELTHAANLYPRELSGGMRKRVDLARALAVSPQMILMDEPYGALDAMTKERLQVQFLKVCEETNATSLFVTHDIEEALFLGDRIVVLGRNPGHIAHIINVPFGDNRSIELKRSAEFQQLRGEVSDLIH